MQIIVFTSFWAMLERKGGVHVKGGVISGIHFRYNYFFKKNGLDPI